MITTEQAIEISLKSISEVDKSLLEGISNLIRQELESCGFHASHGIHREGYKAILRL